MRRKKDKWPSVKILERNIDWVFPEFKYPVVGIQVMQGPMSLAYALRRPYIYLQEISANDFHE